MNENGEYLEVCIRWYSRIMCISGWWSSMRWASFSIIMLGWKWSGLQNKNLCLFFTCMKHENCIIDLIGRRNGGLFVELASQCWWKEKKFRFLCVLLFGSLLTWENGHVFISFEAINFFFLVLYLRHSNHTFEILLQNCSSTSWPEVH